MQQLGPKQPSQHRLTRRSSQAAQPSPSWLSSSSSPDSKPIDSYSTSGIAAATEVDGDKLIDSVLCVAITRGEWSGCCRSNRLNLGELCSNTLLAD